MKKILSVAGPVSGLLALKCPFCLLAFAGLTAGVGSFAPLIRRTYQALVLGLGVLFLWFLFRSRRSLPNWVLVLGLLGFAGLMYQVITQAAGAMAIGSAAALSVASVASYVITARRNAYSCCCPPKDSAQSNLNKEKNSN